MKKVFVAWKPACGRSETQALHFGAKPILVTFFRGRHGVFWTAMRYLLSFGKTLQLLSREAPDVVFTLNQPPFLILAVYVHTRLFGGVYILDSHSAAFNDPKWAWARPLYRWIARRAFLNINTNDNHKRIVEQWGGRSVVVSDVPLYHSADYPPQSVNEQSVAVVASFMFDEPIEAVWRAASLTPSVTYYVTGNHRKLDPSLLEGKPANVVLTGFLSRDAYFGLLSSAKAVMVLTTRDDTMQMGAYEALSLARPIVTSDWQILRQSFGDAAVYVDNTPEGIAAGVERLLREQTVFQERALARREARRAHYAGVKRTILEGLESAISPGSIST